MGRGREGEANRKEGGCVKLTKRAPKPQGKRGCAPDCSPESRRDAPLSQLPTRGSWVSHSPKAPFGKTSNCRPSQLPAFPGQSPSACGSTR